ncbi:hypothetical protein PTKIN_Ptkin12aG0050300 [Pterospermum kingtungense]
MLEIPLSSGNSPTFEECRDAQFKCGKITARYPFSGNGIPDYCGHHLLRLDCENDTNTTTIEIVGVKYQVLDILPLDAEGQTLNISRQEYFKNDSCNRSLQNPSPGFKIYGPFELVDTYDYANVTLLYDCQDVIQKSLAHFGCSGNGDSYKDFWVVSDVTDISPPCPVNVTIPIKVRPPLNEIPSYSWLLEHFKEGFYVKWKLDRRVCETCKQTGGACGFNLEFQTTCYCPNATTYGAKECPRPAPTPAGGKYFQFFKNYGFFLLLTSYYIYFNTVLQ